MLEHATTELQTLLFEKQGARGVITLNRPDRLNCINDRMLDELEYLLTRCNRDSGIRLVLLKAAGAKAFCSGIDVECVRDKTALAARAIGRRLHEVFYLCRTLGKPILVEISANWCPNCRAQRPIVDKIFSESKYSNIARFRVDFDINQNAVEEFNVRFLSTLVLFKGKAEVARSVGELDEAKIRLMLNKALPSAIWSDGGAQLRAGTR